MKQILAKGEEQERFKEDFKRELQKKISDSTIKIKILGIKEGSVVVEYTLIKGEINESNHWIMKDWFESQLRGRLPG